MIIKRNAAWLGCSAKTDTDHLYEMWRTYMLGIGILGKERR